jgi:hypothetical protein
METGCIFFEVRTEFLNVRRFLASEGALQSLCAVSDGPSSLTYSWILNVSKRADVTLNFRRVGSDVKCFIIRAVLFGNQFSTIPSTAGSD